MLNWALSGLRTIFVSKGRLHRGNSNEIHVQKISSNKVVVNRSVSVILVIKILPFNCFFLKIFLLLDCLSQKLGIPHPQLIQTFYFRLSLLVICFFLD